MSQSKGPLGDICEKDRCAASAWKHEKNPLRENWEGTVCYNSCPSCNPSDSCEWTSCYDDVAYTLALLDKVTTTIIINQQFDEITKNKSHSQHIVIALQVTSEYCVDQNSVHQSGISNGAMFSYIIATKTNRCPYNVCGACGWTLDLGFHRFDFEPRFASIGPVAGAPNLGYLEVITSLSKAHAIVLNFYF